MENLLNFFLPDEVLLQIFPLLPFESILACKRVCKQWYNLINDPKFCKDYHHTGSLILLFDGADLFCGLTRHNNNNNSKITPHPSYSVHRMHRVTEGRGVHQPQLLSGWSNGVACVKVVNNYFCIYNLFTGVRHPVKDTPLQAHSSNWIYNGFGYDRYDDDYKIIVVCAYRPRKKYDIDEVQNKENSLFWVYSSRNRCWKSFDGFPYAAYSWRDFIIYNPCCFNGRLHCAVVKRELQSDSLVEGKWVILTYDLHTCRFGEISVPVVRCMRAKVIELDGQLCYVYLLNDKWVAEVYDDVGGSWAQRLSVAHSPSDDGLSSYYGLTYMALYELRDGRELGLFIYGKNLVWYDFSNNEIEMIAASTSWKQRQLVQQLSKAKILTFLKGQKNKKLLISTCCSLSLK